MKKLILILISFLILPSVIADGCFVSDYYEHMYLPDQKAIIAWDGNTETMIISSSVSSDVISNMAWIVPIQSYTKPEIEASNISIFKEFVKYFKEDNQQDMFFEYKEGVTGAAPGVEIIEQKKVDIYDITILKATKADELVKWSNKNGYKVADDLIPVLQEYCDKENFYFIANKINLKNKFKEQIELLEKKGVSDEKFGIASCMFYERHEKNVKLALTEAIICMDFDILNEKSYINDAISWKDIMSISEKEFNNLRDEFKEERVSNYICRKIPGFPRGFGNVIAPVSVKKDWIPDAIWCLKDEDSKIYEESEIYLPIREESKIYLYGNINKSKQISAGSSFRRLCSYYTRGVGQEGSFDNLEDAREFLNTYIPQLRQAHLQVYNAIEEKFEKKKNELGKDFVAGMDELCNTIRDDGYGSGILRRGLSTPLKFVFKPENPFYPLKISSIGKGHTNVEVYVVSNNETKDLNNVLAFDKSKEIDDEFREKVKEFIDLTNYTYIIRLNYRGELNKLNNDSVFNLEYIGERPKPEIRKSFIIRFIDWLRNLLK